jgi:antitoxin PrlF
MSYTLTSKGQVTIPKSMRLHLGIQQGDEVNFETLPNGRVAISPADTKPSAKAKRAPEVNPFRQFIGTGIAGLRTEDILRETRGKDSLR